MTPFTIEKMAVLAPMPSASVRIVTMVKPGARSRLLAAWRSPGEGDPWPCAFDGFRLPKVRQGATR